MKVTIIRLSTVKITPIYAKVLHSELVPSELELASTSFILCNIRLIRTYYILQITY